jgi:hypothetical protein
MLLDWFFSAAVGTRWETFYSALANVSLGAGLILFVSALIIFGYANSVLKPAPKSDSAPVQQQK